MSVLSLNERKNYSILDIAKLICAILIVSAHFASETASFPQIIDYAFSVYVIAVPFFFCCSGFLFFDKLKSLQTREQKREYFVKYQKRIWTMYGLWTLVYLPFIIISWIRKGPEAWTRILKWLHTSLVFQTYSTIWFLPALAVGVAIGYFAFSRLKKVPMIIIVAVLYLLGTFGYSYSFIFEGTVVERIYDVYLLIFKTTRNGLFNAFPFIYIGYVFANKSEASIKKNFTKASLLTALCFLLIVVESFVLKLKFGVTGMDFIIALVPFTYFLMETLLGFKLKERNLYIVFRKLSLLIFVSQRLFLSALPSVMPSVFAVLYSNSYLGLLIVMMLTVGFSLAIYSLSKKLPFLKRFM